MSGLRTGPLPGIAICDPSAGDLARTKAMVRRALDALPLGRRVSVRAYTTPEALLAGPPCDICITETDLGSTDGFALIDCARRRNARVIPIVVTRDAENTSALKAWRSRAVAYLLKPLERGEDLEQLKRILDESIRQSMMEEQQESEVSYAKQVE